MNAFLAGLALGFSLIIAIGSQNAFVLKQGLKNQHVFWVCLICAVSDAVLIALGVSGFAMIVTQLPWVESVARYAGALFLLVYGAKSFWSALKSNTMAESTRQSGSLWAAILTCLAFTWLNPHVYLDTVVLLGSISTQYPGEKRSFALGAMLASVLFFFALGYGAKRLGPLFANPYAWKVLDVLIGCVMWGIAWRLLTAFTG